MTCTPTRNSQGYIYKRRDTLRGRFAYRRRYAVLRFPQAVASAVADPGGTSVYTSPSVTTATSVGPPTLALFKSRGHGESEKLISLEVRSLGGNRQCLRFKKKDV